MIARLTRVLYACGRACVRFRWPVIAAWIAVAVVLHLAAASAGEDWTDNLTLPGSGSTRATDLLRERLPQQAYGSIPISLRDPNGTIGDSASKAAIDSTVKNLSAVPHVIRVVSPLDPGASALVSRDGKIAYISVSLDIGSGDTSVDEAQAVLDAADPAKAAGLDVAVGGYVGQKLSKPATESSEAIGLAAAVVILVFAFGTVTAMTLPIVTAIVGLIITLALVTLVGHTTDVPNISPTLATMIGLGVGIDYALFIVTKHKLQLAEDMEMRESIARACATAGGAVVFAGITVAIALCSLLVAGIPLVTTLGFTAAIAVVVSVLAAITLLPALLGVLGERIHSLAVHLGSTHPDEKEPHGWARMARAVGRRPWPALIGSVVLLLVLALPVLQLRLGQSDTSAMPESTTIRQSYDTITDGFGAGTNGPLLIAVKLDSPATADPTKDPRLTGLQSAVAKTPGVQSVAPLTVDKDGTAAVFTAVATTAPAADETEDLVDNLRDTVIPKAVAGTGTTAYVGGQTAGYIDLAEKIANKLPLMIAVVVLLSVVVLLLAFRSVVIPIKAAVMNLLSVAAAYGVVTAVFQEGWGAGVVGLPHAIPIVSFAPPAHVRDPVRAVNGLRGVLGDADAGALPRVGRRQGGGRRRPGGDGPGDHLGRARHGLRVHELRRERRPDREGVRRRPGVRDRHRRYRRPLPARARRDGAPRRAQLVDSGLARPGAAAHQHRGPGLLRRRGQAHTRARTGARARIDARPSDERCGRALGRARNSRPNPRRRNHDECDHDAASEGRPEAAPGGDQRQRGAHEGGQRAG